jgi:hypothetical protein
MTTLVRWGYVPFMLIGINTAAAYLGTVRASELWAVALIVTAIACSFAAERLLPYRRQWNSPLDDAGRDAAHAVVNEAFILASVAVIPVLAAIMPSKWLRGCCH